MLLELAWLGALAGVATELEVIPAEWSAVVEGSAGRLTAPEW